MSRLFLIAAMSLCTLLVDAAADTRKNAAIATSSSTQDHAIQQRRVVLAVHGALASFAALGTCAGCFQGDYDRAFNAAIATACFVASHIVWQRGMEMRRKEQQQQ